MKQQQYNSNSFTFLRFNKKYKNYNINLNQKRLTKLEKATVNDAPLYYSVNYTEKEAKRDKRIRIPRLSLYPWRATFPSARLLKAQASSLWREISSVVVFHRGKITANSNSSTRIIPTDRFTPGFLLGLRAYNNAPRIKSML